MSPLVRRCSRLVCLLTVLWTVVRSAASQTQPSTGVGTALQPSDVARLILQDITSNIQPLVNKLVSRIDGIDARLNTRLNNIEARLNALDFKQDNFDAGLDGLTSRMDSADNNLISRLDELVSRVDAAEGNLDLRLDELVSRVNSANSKHDSRLEGLVSQVNSTERRLDSRLDELVSRMDSADNSHGSRLEGLVSKVNFMEERLDSRLDELVSRMDSADNSHCSRLEGLVSRVNSTESRLDSRLVEVISSVDESATERDHLANIPSRLDRVSSRLDELANRTDQEHTDKPDPDMPPRDCSELHEGAQSGIHLIQPGLDRSQLPVAAYCDLETDGGGWTVIQRRADIQPRQDFSLGWSAYSDGFGQLDAEFWWGLEKVWRLTGPRDRQYELRVDLADFDGERRHAIYRVFRVASEADGYRLFVAGYTGDAGDSLSPHIGEKFSTPDRDEDSSTSKHCAQKYKAGWWFIFCYYSNLNGPYLSGQQDKHGGINWHSFRRNNYSLKEAKMMVRPVTAD